MKKVSFQELKNFRIPVGFRGRSILYVQLWNIIQASLFSCSPQVLYGWRRFLLRLFGARIGVGVIVRPDAKITYPWKVSIGDHAWIGDNVTLYSLAEIRIGHDVVISQKSYICTGTHNILKPDFPIMALPIQIEPEVWIAADVFVGPGVTIGEGTIVGARSSVFKDLPNNVIAFGYPAKIKKNRL